MSGDTLTNTADVVGAIEDAIGAELLRSRLLGGQPPLLAGRYRVEGLLGRGATGVVIQARDERLERRAALKLSPLGDDDSVLVEGRALASLEHANVVRVFDVTQIDATIDGRAYRLAALVMQLVDGPTLRSWLSEQERSAPEILRQYAAAGEGLHAAHCMHIVHRDFKPDNVLVGHDGVVRVIDFGFATTHDRMSSQAPAEVAGTGPYLAPEARRGEQTPLGDQFAFGASLAEALTGTLTTPLGQAPSFVDPKLWKVLQRMTATEPGLRFPDMRQALRALARRRRVTPTQVALSLALISMLGLAVVAVAIVAGLWFAGQTQDPVSRVTGDWEFETLVESSSDSRVPQGSRGGYSLEIDPSGSQSVRLHPRRVWDARPGAAERPIDEGRGVAPRERITAGVVEEGSEVHIDAPMVFANVRGTPSPYTHTFHWAFDGDHVRCTFTATGSGGRHYRGHCSSGQRVTVSPTSSAPASR